MESRSVYLGIAVRMRGTSAGALSRTYLHSAITEWLWCLVSESESLFGAKLAHAMMLASLYGNPTAKLDDGNDQIHEMYIDALNTIPYLKAAGLRKSGENDDLVAEWRRVNAEDAAMRAKKEAEPAEEGSHV